MRLMKTGLAVAASVLLAGAAYAVPVTGVAIAPSNFNISIAADGLGTTTGSGAITGSATTDLTVTSSNASTVGGSGSFNVATFTTAPPLVALGATEIDGFHIDVALPATTSTAGGPTVFNPDLAGTVVTVDSGFVVQVSTGATLFDFSKSPTVVTAPAGSLTTLDVAAQTWTIPFTTTSSLTTSGVPVNITIGTDLVLAIPEPGTLLLLGAGLAGLVAVGRRKGA